MFVARAVPAMALQPATAVLINVLGLRSPHHGTLRFAEVLPVLFLARKPQLLLIAVLLIRMLY